MQTKYLQLATEFENITPVQRLRHRLADQLHRMGNLFQPGAGGSRLHGEQVGAHIFARSMRQVFCQQGQRQAVRLTGITFFQEGHVLWQGAAALEPGLERFRRRDTPAAEAQLAGEILQGGAVFFHGETPMQSQGFGGE